MNDFRKRKIHLRYIFNFRDDRPILARIIYIIIRRVSEKKELKKNIYSKIKIFIFFFFLIFHEFIIINISI